MKVYPILLFLWEFEMEYLGNQIWDGRIKKRKLLFDSQSMLKGANEVGGSLVHCYEGNMLHFQCIIEHWPLHLLLFLVSNKDQGFHLNVFS